MTRERCKELLPVMMAFADGEAIEYRGRYANATWRDCDDSAWAGDIDYRVKPKPLEVWVVVDEGGRLVAFKNTEAQARGFCDDSAAPSRQGYRVAKMREVEGGE